MIVHPIGVVRNQARTRDERRWENVQSTIEVFPEFVSGLDQIEVFSHLIVAFWMNGLDESERSTVKVHPRRKPELPLVGVFATRSPARPNPIGITVVRLIGKVANVLTVEGLDALDGSPVVDIKPYLPDGDSVSGATGPAWLKKSSESGNA